MAYTGGMDKYDPRHTPSETELAELNDNWTEADEEGKQYDPNRGDHVDVLNDTTPLPKPVGIPRKKRSKKGLLVALAVLVLLGAAAYYWFGMRTKTAAPAKPKTTTQTTVKSPAKADTITTKSYTSPAFAVGLDYPDTWKINEGDVKLAITSPQMSFTTADGKHASGYVQVNVESRQTTLPEFAKGNGTAVLDSDKVTYKKPTQLQRDQTYITFVGYAGAVAHGLDAIYVTGGNGYVLDQTVPMTDVIQTDPLVRVTFLSCTDQTCAGTPTALTLSSTAWSNTEISAPVKTILQSLSFN